MIPVPSIEKQREIISEYNTIQNRITLNNQLIQKLEETAQTLYKHWFVDFEFPNENGKPYKLNGGEMVDSELGIIPKGWKVNSISDFGNVVTGKTPSSDSPEQFGNEMPFVTPGDFSNYNKFAIGALRKLSHEGIYAFRGKILKKGSVIVTCIGSDMGKVVITESDCITNQQMNSIVLKETFYSDFLYYYLVTISGELKSMALGGSTMPMLNKTDFEKILLLKPTDKLLIDFNDILKPLNAKNLNVSKTTNYLYSMLNLLLSKLSTIEN